MELSRACGIGATVLLCLFLALAILAHPLLALLIVLLVIGRYVAQTKERHARLKRYARMD